MTPNERASPRGLSRVLEVWVDHPALDWVIAAGIVGAVLHFEVANYITISDHSGFYQAIVGISLGLLSLGSISLTLLVTVTPSEKLKRVQQEAGRELIRIMVWCLLVLVLTTFAFCGLFLLDQSAQILPRIIVSAVAVTLMISSTVRLLWLLYHLLILMS